ncbi:U2 snRNP component Hsh155p [[Candida] jaroonii]|uniref:U2 snRNP component Hsh155p n=1 Tax=[Candida] jaroonii TaxID=467808 RepID=A0ACA9Y5Z3_9ASCO|nr:U2 snRNP component Hsh155p [[Candida] jaroonii]
MSSRRKNLVGTYTIPKQLAVDIQSENDRYDSISTEELKDNTKNEYNKQSSKLTDVVNNGQLTYKQRIQHNNGQNTESEQLQIEIQSPMKRRRRRRWDVTPEEREKLLELEQDKTLSQILSHQVPVYRGLPLTDEILDKILPEGYVKATIPKDIIAKQATNDTYMPLSSDVQNQKAMEELMVTKLPEINGIEFFRKEDQKYFGKLDLIKNKQNLSTEEKNELKVMELLLKIKNGNNIVRKKSLRQLTDSVKNIGPEPMFNQVLPLLIEPSLEDQERHVLVKLIGRVIFKLDDKVRPYTQKILAAVSPLLIDEDFNLRLEAREIISSLSQAAGLANILSTLRPDLSNNDEYIRNITSRVLAVVGNTLGLTNFLPFLKAVIKSKKSWQAKHTGIKIIQQLCIQLGSGNGNSILPHLRQFVVLLTPAISDDQAQIRMITANTLSQLADTVAPYGIESFEPIIEPLWNGMKKHRGKGLATFLRALGSIIPLMKNDSNYEEYANYYTKELVGVISREFNSPDDEIRSTILRVLTKLPINRQLIKNYESTIYSPFMKSFWNRRTATDVKFLYKLVVNTTTELALKLNYLKMIEKLIVFTKDSNELLRKMAVETIWKIISTKPEELIGMEPKLEEKLVDGVLFAFQEQTQQNKVYLSGMSIVAKTLGIRLKPHINSILSTVLYRIKNKSPEVRQQAALLIAAIAPTVQKCTHGESDIIQRLILILYESLGEVYPDVLASLLTALNSCLESFSSEDLLGLQNPSINQLVPSLSPILKNRQEKVQESCILVIGLIARKCAETINVREWMRICFDLLDTLKSPKKRIRIAANSTFGDIAKTIGPQDILSMLLNNLRVQERQLRVCTSVAIGIVAEVCSPFTVIPAIMNEYRTPDTNVQNGVLKAMTFLFEYIDGNMTKDYLYAITPLLQDALTDRDQVHRQTAATVIKHMALNCQGCITDEYVDVFIHYLNLLIPNVFETSPHVIARILEAIDAIKNVIGYGRYTNYIWAGLFHPAKKVRASYWKLYNMAYIQNADAIVPYFPELESLSIEGEKHEIEEFDLFL